MSHFAMAFGTATKNKQGKIIESYFPEPILSPDDKLINELAQIFACADGNQVIEVSIDKCHDLATIFESFGLNLSTTFAKAALDSEQPLILVTLETDSAPTEVPEAFLKLHLLSHRLVKPHGTNLDGIFGLLHNIAWTNLGAIDLPELPEWQIQTRLRGQVLQVFSIDKFPKMTDYVVPTGVRIADTARVRLGAHLGEGTTIMHEGFVNFNAGTTGVSMVEGRITAGVVVGNGSDIGGGASILGTLSGGGKIVISIGENCLLGANAGVGIPLGDRCTIEAGLYLTAGTKVTVLDTNKKPVETVKARELAGKSDLLFWRNSQTGAVECLTNQTAIELNEALHSHN
ncbi:2,3,4,5-tetrahydropyridine-2,6-dicarboxylate N-succinyltransferase [Gynuella sp.]|uniref:2,3,4,5-tetrahydropyridine-2,6-dicarboxylate N-succinyltransferase n=1 Tax=Gynuella sp. TaxID=2969146 RepID=UPI003D13EEAE